MKQKEWSWEMAAYSEHGLWVLLNVLPSMLFPCNSSREQFHAMVQLGNPLNWISRKPDPHVVGPGIPSSRNTLRVILLFQDTGIM